MAHVAFVLADDFEDSEFQVPYDRIREAGHDVTVVGTEQGKVTGKKGSVTQAIDATPGDVSADAFDALVVPGGYSPDKLRSDPHLVHFVAGFTSSSKPVAFICHAGSLLIETGALDGKRVTSWPSIKTDLVNAGAQWVDEEVVEDGNLISSRNPGDLDAFTAAILQRLG